MKPSCQAPLSFLLAANQFLSFVNADEIRQSEFIIKRTGSVLMILEIATLSIKSGANPQFEKDIASARAIFARSLGFIDLELHHSTEEANIYYLFVVWATLENHLVDFRSSSNFTEWRAIIAPHTIRPPEVRHFTKVFL